MSCIKFIAALLAASSLPLSSALPTIQARQQNSVYDIADPTAGPVPGQSYLYTNYTGIEAPWPGNITGATLNTTDGPAGEDDLLFQNLLAAEWIIFEFYQQAVEMYNESSFTTLPEPRLNTTYERIQQIRNGEAGHLRIFQNQISSNSVKPGPCQYVFPFNSSTPETFLALQLVIEQSSMHFLTGLARQAMLNTSKSALVAIAETETRHNTWALITNWASNPFAGPADTVFPYANQVLDTVNGFVVPDSCPAENPIYPNPRQNLPQFTAGYGTTGLAPGDTVVYEFTQPDNQPTLDQSTQYYAVFFHGLYNISMPFDLSTNTSTIPTEMDDLGLYVVVLADQEGAPTMESVIAGPSTVLQQPAGLSYALAGL